jgi:hypothetical protein
VLEPEAGIVGIGSGGNYALAAAGEVISGSVGYAPMVGFAAIVAYGITMFAAFLARFYDRKGWATSSFQASKRFSTSLLSAARFSRNC